MACRKQVCWFEVFFSNLLWQMLTKVDSTDKPKSKPIVHIYFLKRPILGVFNMKQDQTVKQILHQDWFLSHKAREGRIRNDKSADCLLSGLHAPCFPAVYLYLCTNINFFPVKIAIILYCWIRNKSGFFQSPSGLSIGNWHLVFVGCLPNESNYV